MVIVDDGSNDRTAKIAFDFVRKHTIDVVRVILLGRNYGKGEAIRKVSFPQVTSFKFIQLPIEEVIQLFIILYALLLLQAFTCFRYRGENGPPNT